MQFGWADAKASCAHPYLLPTIDSVIKTYTHDKPCRILDLGCGNGYVSAHLKDFGHEVIGIDVAEDAIDVARKSHPNIRFERRSVLDGGLKELLGAPFDIVVSLEVVEHLYRPQALFLESMSLLRHGGILIASTPYHGYLKNLSLSLAGAWDNHFHVERVGGHIKFFSPATIRRMASDAGLQVSTILGTGRIPWLWKSMILVAMKE